MKKILTIILALSISLTSSPTSIFADEIEIDNTSDITTTNDDNENEQDVIDVELENGMFESVKETAEENENNFDDIYEDQYSRADIDLYQNEIIECWRNVLNNGGLLIDDTGHVYLNNEYYIDPMYLGNIIDLVNVSNESIDLGIDYALYDGNKVVFENTEETKEFIENFNDYFQEIENDYMESINENSIKNKSIKKVNGIHKCDYPNGTLIGKVQKNYQNLKNYFMNEDGRLNSEAKAFANTVIFWIKKVKNGGDWDYKKQEVYKGKTFCFQYDGTYKHAGGEFLGNFNYGYTGSFLFNLSTLRKGSYAVGDYDPSDYADWPAIEDGYYLASRLESGNVREYSKTPSWKSYSSTMYKGEISTWSVNVFDGVARVQWSSSNNTILRVVDGKVTALKTGEATISATTNGYTISQKVKVLPPELSWVNTPSEFYPGDSKTWTVLSVPSNVNVKWQSSNTNVATIDKGIIKAMKEGKTTITASIDNIKISKTLTVSPKTISTKLSNIIIYSGDSYKWQINVKPATKVKYTSSNEMVATVDGNGVITAKKKINESKVIISAEAHGKKTFIDVTVKRPSVTIKNKVTSIYAGEKFRFTAMSEPNSSTLEWSSSNPSILSIGSGNGEATAIKPGEVYVHAVVKNRDASDRVKVKVLAPVISFNQTKTTIYKGEKTTWTLNKQPSNAKVSWYSSNIKIAKPDANGTIYAYAPGTVTITCRAENGNEIKKNVTIKAPTLSWGNTVNSLYETKSHKFTVNQNPSSKVNWSSSNTTVATVNANGVVLGKKAGTVTITAKSNGLTITKKITITKPKLVWNKTSNSIKVGKTFNFSVTPTPTGKVTWRSSNTSIATVDAYGKVTGKKAGTFTLYATCNGITISKLIVIRK